MLPKSPSTSSFKDDSDEELPCVTLSQSTHSKSDLEMPPASEVALLRAREDAAERALRDLRGNCNDPLLISLSRSASQGSSGEEGEAALSARVSALQVTEQCENRGTKDDLQMLTAIRDNLPEQSAILNEYIRVLNEKPEKADTVTELILRGVSSSLISGRPPRDVGVCACVLVAALRGGRGGRRGRGGRGGGGGRGARAALHALLNARTDVSALAIAVSAAVEDAEQLLAAHDAARDGTRRGADRLAAALLAHATARVLQQDTPPNTEPAAPLSPESVSLVRSSWRKLPTRAQLTLLRCAGRALAAVGDMGDKEDMVMGDIEGIDTVNPVKTEEMAAEDAASTKATETESVGYESIEHASREEIEGGAALLAALSQPLPRASAFHIDRQQVLTNVSKLQLLFGSRFVPDSENDTFLETHFNCSQTSVDSIDTPIKLDTPFKEETPIKQNQTPKKEIKVKIPMELVKPMRLDNPIKMPDKLHPSMNDPPINDSPMKDPSVNDLPNDAIVPIVKRLAINDSDIKSTPITPVKGMKATQLKLDGFFKQITPVKVEKDEARSPERKRIRRERPERRCAHRSGRS